MNATRAGGSPAAHARRTPAGIIDSSNGSASATPAPRSSMRLDRCFFVRYGISTSEVRRRRRAGLHALAKRIARDDRLHERAKRVVILCGGAHDGAHDGHVVALELAPQGVRHEAL